MSVPPSSLWLLSWFFIVASAQFDNSQLPVTYEDVNVILQELHERWPPLSTPPPSNIPGLTADLCHGSAECVEPRVCFSCASPPCQCFKAPRYANYSCQSSMECDEGEHCEWDASVGTTSGICTSSKYYQGRNRSILSQQFDSVPPLLGFGLSGDRCFSHQHCHGTRSCLSESIFEAEVFKITPCESSSFPCVCTPLNFALCSNSSSCSHGEICASVMFYVPVTFSYRSMESEREAVLEPICISSNLSGHAAVFSVSNNSSVLEFAHMQTATLQAPSAEHNNVPQTFQPVYGDTAPFRVPSLTFFNSFSTNELANEFIVGILSLIIVSQLHNIVESLIQTSSRIDHNTYSSYITFSRLNSFRFVSRLFTTREPFTESVPIASSRCTPQIRCKLLFGPLFALIFLYVVELATILAGTSVRSEYYADHNFDTVVAPVHGPPREPVQDHSDPYCDDFFVSTRGLFESGKVLKCVKPFPKEPDAALRDTIRVSVFYGTGETVFEIYSLNGTYSAVELSTSLRSKSGLNMKTMPFRPDLMRRQERTLFLNNVLNGIRRRLGYDVIDVRSAVWSTLQHIGTSETLESIEFAHRPNWNESAETITNAVTSGLRDLDLVLNSSGQPWIYTRPYTIEQQNALMAIVKPYRISHGWLLLCAILVSVIHIVTNSFATHFTEVAYIAMKELMADDCALGPLAESKSEAIDVDLRSLQSFGTNNNNS